MTTIRLHVNGQDHAVDAPPNARLLDVLHDPLGLRGTRFGCGANQCGACHVLVGDRSLPACDTPLWAAQDQAITTVEGLSPALRQAFIDEQAAQPSIGQSVQRPDLPALLAGAAHFIHDLAPPGMLHGRVLHPPQWGAQVLAWDEAAARACPGLLHLQRDGQLFGVVAASGADADAALAALVASLTWSTLDSPADEADDLQRLPAKITLVGEKLAPPASTTAAAATAAAPSSAPATRHLQARYTKPWIAHASLAPSCALARWGDDGHLHVWSHSQGIFNLRRDLALAFSMPADKVRVSHARGAGCYGHNGADDVAFDAAWLARALPGRTVRLLWRRADEFNHSPQGPAMVVEISAEITDQTRVNEPCPSDITASPTHRITDWHHTVWSPGHSRRPGRSPGPAFLGAWQLATPAAVPASIDVGLAQGGGAARNAAPGYDFAAWRVQCHSVVTTRRSSALRALGAFANVFAAESFIDELAHASGVDPLALRRQHLSHDPRALAVLDAAVQRAGYAGRQRQDAVGHGLAVARYKGSGAWCAVVAQVHAGQRLRVQRLTISVDVGTAVNPDGVVNQIEGGAVQATSWTLLEAANASHSGWGDYPILKFSDVPAVDVVLMPSTDTPLGAGEASMGPTAAAIANALFDALGLRVRDLPLTPQRIMAAMDAA